MPRDATGEESRMFVDKPSYCWRASSKFWKSLALRTHQAELTTEALATQWLVR